MALTAAMKVEMRKMTPAQIAAVLQNTDEPRSSKQERTAHGKIQKKDHVLVAAVAKATRPLNSWIAYRSYYSTIFLTFQQKEISGFLTILWQNDPFKAKWSILAKSYSLIRDSQGKANAPLEKFLAINGPLIGIIEPAQYLEALSWEVAVNEDGQTIMRRYGTPIDEQLFITNVSVNDVIRNSYDRGYFTGDLSKVLLSKNEAAMTMAASVQSTSNTQYSTTDHLKSHDAKSATCANTEGSSKEKEQLLTTIVIDDDESDSDMATDASEARGEESVAEDSDDVPKDSNAVAIENTQPNGNASAVMTSTVTSDQQNLDPSSHSKIDADMTEVESRSKASANDLEGSNMSPSAFTLNGEYPFNAEFDPDFSGATFNPFMGNQFDIFEMSNGWEDLIDFDAVV